VSERQSGTDAAAEVSGGGAGLRAAALTIDVFADVVCPWCCIGEGRLARVLADVEERRPGLVVERHWRPFQLQPQLPPGGVSWAELVRGRSGGEMALSNA
jgi:predicted DsbA family dithiol-disulfide isomerase